MCPSINLRNLVLNLYFLSYHLININILSNKDKKVKCHCQSIFVYIYFHILHHKRNILSNISKSTLGSHNEYLFTGLCIQPDLLCDNTNDCGDLSDEQNCGSYPNICDFEENQLCLWIQEPENDDIGKI